MYTLGRLQYDQARRNETSTTNPSFLACRMLVILGLGKIARQSEQIANGGIVPSRMHIVLSHKSLSQKRIDTRAKYVDILKSEKQE